MIEFLQDSGGHILQIESRPSKYAGGELDFLIGLRDADNLKDVCEKIVSNLKPIAPNVAKHGGEKGKVQVCQIIFIICSEFFCNMIVLLF